MYLTQTECLYYDFSEAIRLLCNSNPYNVCSGAVIQVVVEGTLSIINLFFSASPLYAFVQILSDCVTDYERNKGKERACPSQSFSGGPVILPINFEV